MTPTLSVVADNNPLVSPGLGEPGREVLSDRIKRLQAEAKGLAREHVQALEDALLVVERMAAEIADGGDAYPVGVREMSRRLAEDCEARIQGLEALISRR